MDEPDEAGDVLRRLVDYWRAHPQAADSAEGIRQWWLVDPTVSRQAVDTALQRLVRQGRVVAVQAADGRVRFRWNAATENE